METLSALLAGEQYHGHLRESHVVIAVSVVIVIAVLSEYQTQNMGVVVAIDTYRTSQEIFIWFEFTRFFCMVQFVSLPGGSQS